jgi:hypothetical protein
MRKRIHGGWYLAIALVFSVAPCAFAQQLQISNPPSNNVLDGNYVGSYTATNLATGGSVQITCDDFKDNSNYNPATYTTNTFSSLGSTLWGSNLLASGSSIGQVTQLYDEVAWLTLGMLKQTGTQQGYYSYAIWAIFSPNQVAAWLTSYNDAAACNAVFGNGSWGWHGCTAGKGGLVGTAASQIYTSGEFSNILILTPQGCRNGPGSCPEQEFLEVVAEGGSAAAYLLLAGLACFAAVYFRSRQQMPAGKSA